MALVVYIYSSLFVKQCCKFGFSSESYCMHSIVLSTPTFFCAMFQEKAVLCKWEVGFSEQNPFSAT